MLASSSLTDNLNSFFDAVGQFFSNLAAVHWGSLTVAMLFFGLNLTLRSRAIFNTLRAAYPARRFEWRRVWGAYFAAVGFNNVVPIRGGDVIKLYLTKTSIPDSSYPATAAAFFTEAIFDSCVGVLVLIYAFSQGVFPKPPDFSKVNAFDLSYFAGHPRFTLFLLTAAAVLAVVAFAVLSRRVRAFWARVRQGFTILSDRRRYLRQVAALQAAGWLCRFVAFWLLLDAFRVGGSVRNTLLVFGVNAVAGAVPFTPGGAGVQQALLVKVFAHTAAGATVAAYSVGQEIAIAAFSFSVGFAALFVIFRFRSFREVIHAGRAAREAEEAAAAAPRRGADEAAERRRRPTAGPRGPRAPGSPPRETRRP